MITAPVMKELMNIARIISGNIVAHINELNLVTDSVDATIKLFPLLHICNNRVSCFINLQHDFVLLPGVFEALLFYQKNIRNFIRDFIRTETLLEQNPETATYSRVSNRRGGRNKRGGWQISAKMINGEGAINGEVGKNLQG